MDVNYPLIISCMSKYLAICRQGASTEIKRRGISQSECPLVGMQLETFWSDVKLFTSDENQGRDVRKTVYFQINFLVNLKSPLE